MARPNRNPTETAISRAANKAAIESIKNDTASIIVTASKLPKLLEDSLENVMKNITALKEFANEVSTNGLEVFISGIDEKIASKQAEYNESLRVIKEEEEEAIKISKRVLEESTYELAESVRKNKELTFKNLCSALGYIGVTKEEYERLTETYKKAFAEIDSIKASEYTRGLETAEERWKKAYATLETEHTILAEVNRSKIENLEHTIVNLKEQLNNANSRLAEVPNQIANALGASKSNTVINTAK